MDDIVTRLREVAVQEYKDGWAVFPVCDRAANEIERLREIIDNLIQYGECDGTDACDDCLWDLWVDKYKAVASE